MQMHFDHLDTVNIVLSFLKGETEAQRSKVTCPDSLWIPSLLTTGLSFLLKSTGGVQPHWGLSQSPWASAPTHVALSYTAWAW